MAFFLGQVGHLVRHGHPHSAPSSRYSARTRPARRLVPAHVVEGRSADESEGLPPTVAGPPCYPSPGPGTRTVYTLDNRPYVTPSHVTTATTNMNWSVLTTVAPDNCVLVAPLADDLADDLLEFAREYERRSGKRFACLVTAANYTEREAYRATLARLLAELDERGEGRRRRALRHRERAPRPRPPPPRRRTCGASSRYSARPPAW